MMHTIPHLVRMCRFPFVEKVLFIDTAPLSGDKILRPGIGTLEALRHCCDQLIAQGHMDKAIDIDYSEACRQRLYQKHFHRQIRSTHNYKGYPIFGTIFSLEEISGDYLLHFDSDMLLHQTASYSWIEAGIELLKSCPEIMAVRPLAGPPFEGIREDQTQPDGRDQLGFYWFKFFSSRAYLIDRQRFDQLLPLPVLWRSFREKWKWLNFIPNDLKTWLNGSLGRGQLDSWEIMVSRKLDQTELIRATMDHPQAWTLHPKDRSPEFIQALPAIIEKIENGWYPAEQAGYYDLQLKYWLAA